MLGLGALFCLFYFVQGIIEPTEGLLSQPIKSLLRNWGTLRIDGMVHLGASLQFHC